MAENPIYLDYAATTPVHPLVLQEMLPYFTTHFGNAASQSHNFGRVAREAVSVARKQAASLICADERQIYFTSGATEGINAAIKGVFAQHNFSGHIIAAATDHKAVLDTCAYVEQLGGSVSYLPVDENGLIDLTQLLRAIRKDTILACILWANNETGVIQNMTGIASICRERNICLFSDATQAVGKIPLNVAAVPVDMLCFSAHKLYGPKGCGALYVRNKTVLQPLIHGGGHEQGLRSGTLNVPGIVGLGAACEMASTHLASEYLRLEELRNYLEMQLQASCNAVVNGRGANRLPGISNMQFVGRESSEIMANLPNIALSSGSACTSQTITPSHVLQAMGLSPQEAHSSVRISMGIFTTKEEIDRLLHAMDAGSKPLP